MGCSKDLWFISLHLKKVYMRVNYFASLLQAIDLQPMDPNGLVSIICSNFSHLSHGFASWKINQTCRRSCLMVSHICVSDQWSQFRRYFLAG